MYLHKRGNNYIYRRRIPLEIQPFIELKVFKKALVPDIKSAQMIASKYNLIFNKMIVSIRLGIDITNLIKELDLFVPEPEATNSKQSILEPKQQRDIYKDFLKSKEDVSTSSYREYKQQLELLKVILPKDFSTVSYLTVDTVKDILIKLPKRNIQKYRSMPLKELIKIKVEEGDRISVKSRNEYLKTFRALLNFGLEREYITRPVTIKLFTDKMSARNQREALSLEKVNLLCSHNDSRMADMSKILYYTGMRLSEVYKCKITTVDNILCFDLSDKSIDLKTNSSYRIIPVHQKLIGIIEEILQNATSIMDKRHTRMASQALNSQGQTLYSLRHTFATQLTSKGIEPHIISELLGHTHNGMTLGRYVKGFPVELLSVVINKLEPI
jgi:integrase